MLILADGGEIALDWGTIENHGHVTPSPNQQDMPVLLILPGITGSSDKNYAMHLTQDGIASGYRPVVFNQRGNGGMKLKVCQINHG